MVQYISNSSSYRTVNGTSYADDIWNDALTTRVTVNGGAGNDTIRNWGTYSKIDAGAGNDSIYSFAWYTTLNGGAGNDTVSLYSSGHHNVIQYASGGGNDVVYNLGSTDTISITGGSYTRSTVGNDVVLKVGSGAVTVKGGKGKTVNVRSNLSSSADLASDDWISADDNNFVMNDTRLDSIVETTATDYSVGKLDTATTSLTPRNIFVAFTGKK